MIKQDILEKQVRSSYLAIGSNLGDRYNNIQKAQKFLLSKKIHIEDISNYYETPSWPNKKFPKFFNVILKIRSNHKLLDLFKIIKNIEYKMGRKKSIKNCPRICDIDIIDFKGLNLKTNLNGQKIVTPHPRMHNRNFVLFPLFELNKRWIHPKTKHKINELINRFNNMDFSDIRIVKNK